MGCRWHALSVRGGSSIFRGSNKPLGSYKVSNETTILYGGSCKPSNSLEIFSQHDIDGGLIGGASLNSTDFVSIIKSL